MGILLTHKCEETHCMPAADSFDFGSFSSKLPSLKFNFGGSSGGGDGGDPTEEMIKHAFALLSPLGFGGICGICTAVYVKKVGSQAMYIGGMAFIFLQGLAYMGYIDIDYKKVVDDTSKVIDADGDGKITSNDFIAIWKEVKKILMFNLPGGSGFAAGFALGLKYF